MSHCPDCKDFNVKCDVDPGDYDIYCEYFQSKEEEEKEVNTDENEV